MKLQQLFKIISFASYLIMSLSLLASEPKKEDQTKQINGSAETKQRQEQQVPTPSQEITSVYVYDPEEMRFYIVDLPKNTSADIPASSISSHTTSDAKQQAETSDTKKQDDKGNTPLHEAIRVQNLEAIQLLLAHNADVTIANKAGITPLQLAHDLTEKNEKDANFDDKESLVASENAQLIMVALEWAKVHQIFNKGHTCNQSKSNRDSSTDKKDGL